VLVVARLPPALGDEEERRDLPVLRKPLDSVAAQSTMTGQGWARMNKRS